ncbi:hypothetical protein [Tenacibaculum sp. 1_MG-2023]|uniref:hypothetical protein n=1 Tax=Tenacibaculum sp. 1_MG-2023 TaxID=3062653 RepID=UPI0038B4863B
MGCVFTNQIATNTSEDIIAYLKKHNILTLQNSNECHKNDYTKATALVVGTEATELTQVWRDKATQNINTPCKER